MINRVFVDSSLLVEYLKGSKQQLLSELLSKDSIELVINETVVSEYLFYYLKLNGKAAPQSLQSSGKISSILTVSDDYKILKLFQFIYSDESLYDSVPALMIKYNLLSNDAIILASCKLHGISQLASHDTDFIVPCKAEGIELLREED